MLCYRTFPWTLLGRTYRQFVNSYDHLNMSLFLVYSNKPFEKPNRNDHLNMHYM